LLFRDGLAFLIILFAYSQLPATSFQTRKSAILSIETSKTPSPSFIKTHHRLTIYIYSAKEGSDKASSLFFSSIFTHYRATLSLKTYGP